MSLKKNNETHANKVYNFLKKKNKPLSAYEILEELASQGITAPTTIYRALNKLVSNGLIHKIESLNAWTVCCGNHDDKVPIFEIHGQCNNCILN